LTFLKHYALVLGRYDYMNALTKFSIALLLATATAIYLYVSLDHEGFDVARLQSAQSKPQDATCKQDAERLSQLQAKASLVEVLTFAGEIRCVQLWPQLQTLMDRLSNSSVSTNSSSLDRAASGATPTGDAALALGGRSAALDAACTQDEERLARLRAAPSDEEAARFTQELRCETLRPELLSLTGGLTKPSLPDSPSVPQDAEAGTNAANETQPAPQVAAEAEHRIAALESEKEALAAKVSQLEHDREASSADEAKSVLPPAAPAERSEIQPSSQAAANAEHRIAELESEKEALTAEVTRLQHERELPPNEATSTPASPSAALAKRFESESAAALASLPNAMPARVLIRYHFNSADARMQAEKLANALKGQGIEVADLRESASAIRTELSFAYAPDETIAQQVGRLVGVAPMRRLQPKDGLMVRPGTVELNLSGESHFAAVKATSSRESNHE
jgi:hypothetical protein